MGATSCRGKPIKMRADNDDKQFNYYYFYAQAHEHFIA